LEPWKRNLYALWGTEFFAALGMACVLPFLPFYIRELDVQDPRDVERWSGLVFGGPFFAAIFTGPLWGWLGDRYGRRLMLIRAVIGYSATTFCMAFAATPQQLFLLRILQGGIAGFVAATLAIVSTTTPRKHMGYAMGFLPFHRRLSGGPRGLSKHFFHYGLLRRRRRRHGLLFRA
jgi:DHA1 family multidrug resistance protein-like MFS transporter